MKFLNKKIPLWLGLVCFLVPALPLLINVINIIKNEILYRIKVDPRSFVSSLPQKKLSQMVREARIYSEEFLAWKREGVLRKNWKVHTKKTCERDETKIEKEYLGKLQRRTFYCPRCQQLYA